MHSLRSFRRASRRLNHNRLPYNNVILRHNRRRGNLYTRNNRPVRLHKWDIRMRSLDIKARGRNICLDNLNIRLNGRTIWLDDRCTFKRTSRMFNHYRLFCNNDMFHHHRRRDNCSLRNKRLVRLREWDTRLRSLNIWTHTRNIYLRSCDIRLNDRCFVGRTNRRFNNNEPLRHNSTLVHDRRRRWNGSSWN